MTSLPPPRDLDSWADYWVRSWGARGLLHVWHESASAAVVAGLAGHELERMAIRLDLVDEP